jgi:predicted RNase H-like HicB family nuclease
MARGSANMKEGDRVKQLKLTAIIEREGDGFVSICPELDIASQGDSREEARANLVDAVQGFFEVASKSEIEQRLGTERYVEQLEVTVG